MFCNLYHVLPFSYILKVHIKGNKQIIMDLLFIDNIFIIFNGNLYLKW